MRIPIMRSIAIILIAFGVVGCDDFLGLGSDVDADITAEARENKIILVTIENTDSETIYYHRMWLEHRKSGKWSAVESPSDYIERAILLSNPIEEGEKATVEFGYDYIEIEPGEYRIGLQMSTRGGVDNSEIKGSNSVRIE